MNIAWGKKRIVITFMYRPTRHFSCFPLVALHLNLLFSSILYAIPTTTA